MKKLLVLTALAAPALAFAHPGHGGGSFSAGLLHPVGGWDHLLAMLAVGLWAASFEGKARWLVPASFVGVMVLGCAAGAGGINVPLTEQGIAASVLVFGLAAAWLKRVPAPAAVALAGIFALFHGAAHGVESGGHDALGFAAGFILSTALLHAAGYFGGKALLGSVWPVRIAGSLIGLAGLGLLAA